MHHVIVLELVNLFCSGILAGSLFLIHYGVRKPLGTLEDRPQIQLRQSLIDRLRVLIPAVFVPTVLSGVAAAILDWSGPGSIFRSVGALSALVCFLTTLAGTAPINAAVLTWQPDAPPKDWRLQVSRWGRLDAARTWLALGSLALMVAAMAFKPV